MMGWFSAVIERRTLLGWAIFAIVGAIATATLLALTGPSLAAPEDKDDARITLGQLRQATAKYHDVEDAKAAGYVAPDGGCVYSIPLQAGMGYHHVNRDDVVNGALTAGIGGDPLKPEALLYDPEEGTGKLKLVGVEWIVRYEGQDKPVIPGQPDAHFAGPMPGHEAWMPTHYDLHACIWEDNPSGMFAQFNPDVDCDSSTP